MNARIRLSKARMHFAIVWATGALLVIVLVALQAIAGKYAGRSQQAAAWCLSTVLPTLTVIVGSIVAASRNQDPISKSQNVDRSLYILVFALSLFYIAAVLSTLLLQPFSDEKPLEFILNSNVYLAPLQGVVGTALGAFFTAKP